MFPVSDSLLFFLLSVSFQSVLGSIWLDECNRTVGLQDGRVLDSQLSASSFYENFYIGSGKTVHTKPQYSRLYNTRAWCASGGRNHYIQVDLPQTLILTGIATQGFSGVNDYFVKTFRVVYSRDGAKWHRIKRVFTANSDSQKVVKNTFPVPISAQHVRVYPIRFNYNICLRMELYGCSNLTVAENSSVAVSTTPTSIAPTKPEKQNSSNSGEILSTSSPPDSLQTTATAPNVVLTQNKTVVRIPAHAPRNVSVTTGPSLPGSVPSEKTVGVAAKGGYGGGKVSRRERTLDPVMIGSLVTASFVLIVVVPFLMCLVFLRHQRQRRCFSSYAVGSYVAYGEPLASCKHSSDKDSDSVQEIDEINAIKEKFNTDEINLLSPHAV